MVPPNQYVSKFVIFLTNRIVKQALVDTKIRLHPVATIRSRVEMIYA